MAYFRRVETTEFVPVHFGTKPKNCSHAVTTYLYKSIGAKYAQDMQRVEVCSACGTEDIPYDGY